MNPNTQEPESTLPVPSAPPSLTVVVIGALVIVVVVTVIAMVLTSIFLPDNPTLACSIVRYTGEITAALLILLRSTQNAAGIQKVHVDLNSRLTAYMRDLALAERAKGVLQGTEAAT